MGLTVELLTPEKSISGGSNKKIYLPHIAVRAPFPVLPVCLFRIGSHRFGSGFGGHHPILQADQNSSSSSARGIVRLLVQEPLLIWFEQAKRSAPRSG